MDTLKNKIQSIRDSIGASYIKPSTEKLEEYKENLKNNTVAMDYLLITRNLTQETIEHFQLGYSKSKNAIAIPEFKRGELINFKYRHLDDENTRYSQLKGCEVWVFNEDGFEEAKKSGRIIISEGQFDAMSLWQAGYKSVISPSSGKESYGAWIEIVESIPKIYIAYDNDKGGKKTALEIAEKIGVDKSFEVFYPDGIKDANDFFKKYTVKEFGQLVKEAKPFYKYKFAGLGEVVNELKIKGDNRIKLDTVPYVKFDTDWMVVVSGDSGIGKTSYVMNIANELVNKGIPTLVFPFERGIKTVGGRYIQVRLNKTEDELRAYDDSDWDKVLPDLIDLPLYFSKPTKEQVLDTVQKAKKYLGVKFVIVDHLDYSIVTGQNDVSEMKKVLQDWKEVCLNEEVCFIVVHHINKPKQTGMAKQKLTKEDLKGGSASYQVPEAVVLLSSPSEGVVEVDVVKNKGEEGSRVYEFKKSTGKIGTDITTEHKAPSLDEF